MEAEERAVEEMLPRPLRCFLCCCCWTGTGVWRLLNTPDMLAPKVASFVSKHEDALAQASPAILGRRQR